MLWLNVRVPGIPTGQQSSSETGQRTSSLDVPATLQRLLGKLSPQPLHPTSQSLGGTVTSSLCWVTAQAQLSSTRCPTVAHSTLAKYAFLLAASLEGDLHQGSTEAATTHHSPPRWVQQGSWRVKVPTKTGRCPLVPRLLQFHFPLQPACLAACSLAPLAHTHMPGCQGGPCPPVMCQR